MAHKITFKFIKKQNYSESMGGEESKPAKFVQPNSNVESFPSEIGHDCFRNFQYTKGHEGENNIEVRVPISSEEEYRQWENSLKDCPTQHEFYLMPQQIHLLNEGLCGNTHFLEIVYEHFPHILAEQIANRAKLEAKFQYKESELWYLLYVLVSAVRDFHLKNKKVGDIRPSNIFINNQGQLKVATYLSFPSERTNYEKSLNEKQITYLAPEEVKDLQLLKLTPAGDSSLAESFSVGLTCLDAAILESSNQMYTKNNLNEELTRKKNILRSKNYSKQYCKVIEDLCCLNPNERASCSEIYKMLEPHQDKIMDLQPFQLGKKKEKQIYKTNVFSVNNPEDQVKFVRHSQVKLPNNKPSTPVRFTYTPLKQSEKVEPSTIQGNKSEAKNDFTPTKSHYVSYAQQNNTASPSLVHYVHHPYSGSKNSSVSNEQQRLENAHKAKAEKSGFNVGGSLSSSKHSGIRKDKQIFDFSKIDEQLLKSKKMFP